MASKEVFESAFEEYGLPEVLRTDNGTSFSGIHGISALSVWWVQLGIKPERIQRGKPTQNGRHERMHRTLKEDAIHSEAVASSPFAQQRVFDRFRTTFNHERPHEALDMETPQLQGRRERRNGQNGLQWEPQLLPIKPVRSVANHPGRTQLPELRRTYDV